MKVTSQGNTPENNRRSGKKNGDNVTAGIAGGHFGMRASSEQ